MIKLVTIDLDGTLLNSSKKIEDSAKKSIQAYLKKGVIFSFCTGRAYVEMDDVVKDIPNIEYAITANGGYCYNTKKKEDIFKFPFSKKEVAHIYGELKKYDMIFELYKDGKIYCEKDEKQEYYDYIPLEFHSLLKESRTIVQDMSTFIKNMNGDTLKIHTFFGSVTDRDVAFQCVQNLPYSMISQSINEIEFSPKGVNKGTGIKKLSHLLQIKKEDILAIGDNFNDMSMRTSAGTLVAMENAVEPLKKISDFVTKSNDEDGISLALEKFLS